MTSLLGIAAPEQTTPRDRPAPGDVEVLTSIDEIDAIEDAWRALAVVRGNAFITPEWYRAWHQVYSQRGRPFVVAVRHQDGSLRGVLPLKVGVGRRARAVRFAGSGLGDVFHPACLPGDDDAVAAAAARALAAHRTEWAIAVLHNTEAGGTWPARLANAAGGLTVTEGQPTPAPYIDLEGLTWETFLAGRGRKLRKNLGNYRRRLERQHRVEFRKTETPGEVYADLQLFLHLHEARFAGTDQSPLSAGEARAFHLAFARQALEQGWLRLWFLYADDQPIATSLSWQLGNRYADYNGGFDPRWSHFSPGLLLLGHEIKDAICGGAQVYDLLLGGEAYKRRFTEDERQVRTVIIAPRAHPQRLSYMAQQQVRSAVELLPDGLADALSAAGRPLARRLTTSRSRG